MSSGEQFVYFVHKMSGAPRSYLIFSSSSNILITEGTFNLASRKFRISPASLPLNSGERFPIFPSKNALCSNVTPPTTLNEGRYSNVNQERS
jgi:hypothetical protein